MYLRLLLGISVLHFRPWWISGVVVLLQQIKVVMLVTVDTQNEFSLAMSSSHKILRMYIELTRPSV
jgi:hypothetical protein